MYEAYHIKSNVRVGVITEEEKKRYEDHPSLRFKYRFVPVKKAPEPQKAITSEPEKSIKKKDDK